MTFLLFAIPRFIFGMARTLDVGATFNSYNTSNTPSEADWKAIKDDWQVVGEDLSFALQKSKTTEASYLN